MLITISTWLAILVFLCAIVIYFKCKSFIGHCISSLLLGLVVLVAYYQVYIAKVGRWWRLDKAMKLTLQKLKDKAMQFGAEKDVFSELSFDTEFYIKNHGYEFERHEAITEDGFILHLYRVFKKELRNDQLPPVFLQHGLFQSSGIFVTSEEDSPAFYFADKGYDVWLGNNRGIFEKGHISLKRTDEKYWDWGLDDLGKYDFPAFINYVTRVTGHEKIVYVGHSQGNAQAFIGLAQDPLVANKLTAFIALAPAFYIGRLGHWALEIMASMPAWIYYRIFGTCSFIPIMYIVQRVMPPHAFGSLAYNMFNYLFNWSDTYWCPTRKTKYFLFTPRPTSAKLIHHWGDITKTGQLKPYKHAERKNVAKEKESAEAEEDEYFQQKELEENSLEKPWESNVYSVSDISCPVALFYGGKDKLVMGKNLVETLQASKQVSLVHFSEIPHYEHMDLIWAKDARETVFDPVHKLILELRDKAM